MSFPVVAALFACVVASAVVWPLLRVRAGTDARTRALAVYRDQLAEIDRDVERGLIADAQAEQARLEVQRRLVQLARAPADRPLTVRTRPWVAAATALVLVAGGLWTYTQLGRPGLPGQPLRQRDTQALMAARAAAAADLAELEAMAAETPPDDPRFWLALGQLRNELRGPQAAAQAFRQGLEAFPGNAMLLGALGESLVEQAGGTVIPVAQTLFRQALQTDPAQGVALYYLGLAAVQEGDDATAVERWGQMLWTAPAEAAWRPAVEGMFRDAAARLGLDADALLAAGPAEKPAARPAPVGPMAATGRSGAEQDAMVAEMVARLEARLAETPDDLDGWLRLGRAKVVLGELDAAADAFMRARALAPGDARVPKAEADALLVVADRSMGMPIVSPRIAELFTEAAALDPHDPQPHWYLGLRALQQGRLEAARSAWQATLARVDPASDDYAAVKAQLDALARATGG